MKDAKAIRELNAALGMDEARNLWGLVLAVGGIAILAAGALLVGHGGKASRVYGRVLGFSLTETEQGSFPIARVAVDGREAWVSVPRSTNCKAGDAIQLTRNKGLIGYRYAVDIRGCSAWFSPQGSTPGFGPEWACTDGRSARGGGVCIR